MIQVEELGNDVFVMSLKINRIDFHSANSVKQKIQELQKDKSKTIVVDFDFVDFIDSTGLGIFVSILKKIGSRTRFLLCNMKPNVFHTFKITRMNQVFQIHPSLDDALGAVS